MKKLYIMCGTAFSGKSMLARNIAESKGALLVSQDQSWFERKEEMNLSLDSDEDWEKILLLSRAEVGRLLSDDHSVVYDDISLKYADRELLRGMAAEYGAEAVLIYLDTPREVQQERRRRNRETNERHHIPDHIFEWGHAELEIPQAEERPNVFKPDSITSDWLATLP